MKSQKIPKQAYVKIEWVAPEHDWPYFYFLKEKKGGRIKLQGASYPDGSAHHDGDIFWARWDEMKSIEILPTPEIEHPEKGD